MRAHSRSADQQAPQATTVDLRAAQHIKPMQPAGPGRPAVERQQTLNDSGIRHVIVARTEPRQEASSPGPARRRLPVQFLSSSSDRRNPAAITSPGVGIPCRDAGGEAVAFCRGSVLVEVRGATSVSGAVSSAAAQALHCWFADQDEW